MATKDGANNAIKQRWGNDVIEAGTGWTAIPNFLLERQQALKIDPVQLNILLVLMKHWWNSDEKPYPSKKTIAEIVNRDRDTVRKHLKNLEEKGLIERIERYKPTSDGGGQTSNEYSLEGLVKKLSELAGIEVQEQKQLAENRAMKRRGHTA